MKTCAWILLLVLSPVLPAATWEVNDDHSEILFSVPYLSVSEVTGRFAKFSGDLELDDQGKAHKLAIAIDAASIDTGHAQRDGHLRAQEFIFTQKHPKITFHGQTIQTVTPGKLRVVGVLSLRGETRPLTLEVLLSDVQIDSWKHENRFAKFKLVIKRSDFGIQWNKTLADHKYLVGDEVKVWGHLQLQPVGKATPSSKHLIPDTPSIRQRERLNRGEISRTEYEARVQVSEGVVPKTEAPAPEAQASPVVVYKDPRHSTQWQLWFWGLGLMGFFGALMLAVSAKKWVMDKYPEVYAENGWLGHLSDFLSIGLTFLYAVAFWAVGWGQ